MPPPQGKGSRPANKLWWALVYGYGDAPEKAAFANLDAKQLAMMAEAVEQAVAIAAQVDIVLPTGSTDEKSWKWRLQRLGRNWMSCKTYYAKHPDYKAPFINPPAGIEHRIDLWGVALGTGSAAEQADKNVPLVPRELMALDMSKIRDLRPECKGLMVWTKQPDLLRIMQALPEAVGG